MTLGKSFYLSTSETVLKACRSIKTQQFAPCLAHRLLEVGLIVTTSVWQSIPSALSHSFCLLTLGGTASQEIPTEGDTEAEGGGLPLRELQPAGLSW